MENSLRHSTVEAFAERAGIHARVGAIFIYSDRFEIQTDNGEYILKFREGDVPVAKFYKPADDGSVKFLTREEASDLLEILSSRMNFFKHISAYDEAALTYLKQNLPNLGFSKETPLMKGIKPAQNAKNWAWELNNE